VYTFAVSGVGFGEDQHDGSIAGATTLTSNSENAGAVGGEIQDATDDDVFRIELLKPSTVTFFTTGTTDTTGTLQTPGPTTVLATDNDSGEGLNFEITEALPAGVYFVRVEGNAGATGAYDFRWIVEQNPAAVIKDFDGDGYPDLLWRREAIGAGDTEIDFLQDTELQDRLPTDFRIASLNFHLAGYGDFDGDGHADLLWRRLNDNVFVIHFMVGASRVSTAAVNFAPAPEWEVRAIEDFRLGPGLRTGYQIRSFAWRPFGAGDFNRDGNIDVVWRHESNGLNNVHLLDASANRIGFQLSDPGLNSAWRAVGVIDMDLDGVADIIWRHQGTGSMRIDHSIDQTSRRDRVATDAPARRDLTWRLIAH